MNQEVLWEKRGHVCMMTFNRPDAMNAQTLEMMKAEAQNLQEFIEDDDARAYPGSSH